MALKLNPTEDWQMDHGELKQRSQYLLQSGLMSDCRFLVGSGPTPVEISAHRLLLAMSSPVFEAMLYGLLAEGDRPIVTPDVQPSTFMILLEYLYTDNIVLNNLEAACDLYYCANKYRLPHLKKVCVTYLTLNLTPETVCRIYEMAMLVDEVELARQCQRMIENKTIAVLSSSGFEDLLPNVVLNIFNMDRLNVDSELDLFEAADRYTFGKESIIFKEKARTEVTHRAVVENISRLKVGQKKYTPVFYMCNMPWTIRVRRSTATQLAISLQCSEKSKGWSCLVNFELRLVGFNNNLYSRASKSKTKGRLFHSNDEEYYWGWKNFIEWDALVDPKNEFVNNDSITVEVCASTIETGVTKKDIANLRRNLSDGDSQEFDTVLNKDGPSNVVEMEQRTNNNEKRDEPCQIGIVSEDSKRRYDLGRQLVQRIRFLTLNPREFVEYPHRYLKSLLTDMEIMAIIMNIGSPNATMPMPEGFSTNRNHRNEVLFSSEEMLEM